MKKSVLMFLLFSLSLSLSADITLVKDGITEYVIVLPEKPIKEETDAVNDMKEILKKSTGADFRIVSPAEADKQGKRIFIGFSSPMEKLAGTIPPLENEERVYRNIGDDIFIYGGGKCGTTFSIYQFLMDAIGFRALHFWGDVIIPEHRSLVLKKVFYDKTPSYLYRDILQAQWNIAGCPTSILAFRRMMMHSNQFDSIHRITNSHTFSCFIPRGYKMNQRGNPYDEFKDKAYFKTNPEFFGMDPNGKRTDEKALCFSNPELRKAMTENVDYYISKHRSLGRDSNFVVDIDNDDIGGKFCYCPGCTDLEKKYQAPCGAFYDYLIKDASPYFAAKYPNMIIRFLAYGGKEQTETPPAASALKDGKLPSNLAPNLAYINGDFSKSWQDPANKEIYDKLSGWGKIASQMFVYYYPTTYARPLVTIHMFGNVLRTAHDYVEGSKLNIRYVFNDYSTGFFMADAGFYGLQHYLMARLSNDASLDIDMLVKEYTDAIYGAAGKMMRDYFYELEKLNLTDKGFLPWNTDVRFAEYLTPENLSRWQKNYDAMEELVSRDSNALAHLRCSRINLDLATMLLWNEIQQSGVNHNLNVNEIFNRFMKAADYAGKKCFDPDYKNHVSKEDKLEKRKIVSGRLIDTGRFFYRIAKGGKKLPKEFNVIPLKDIRHVVPVANKEIISFVDDGAFRVALIGKAPKSGTIGYTVFDEQKKYPNIECRVSVVNDEPFSLNYIGRTKLTRGSQATAPSMPYYSHRMLGGQAGFGRAYFGHLFDAKKPDQEWDVYVSCRFKDERCYTDRFVLVKVRNPNDKPLILNRVEKVSPPTVIADVVADADENTEKIAWEKIRPLAAWRECLSGKDSSSSPELKLAFDSKYLYLNYTENGHNAKADADLSKNRAELFFYGDTLYPLLQIAIAKNGHIVCNTHNIMKSTNDMADKTISESIACPGKISSSCKDGIWSWTAAFPLDKLPSFKNGSLNANFYRMSSDNGLVLAWSPLYSDEYCSDLGRFGKIYPGHIIISGSGINCKQRTKDKVAFMDGNHGWEITAYPPKGLDQNCKYRIFAELRSDAESASEPFSTRVGTYDPMTKKITGYVGIQLERIRGEEFVKIPLDRPVNLTPETYIYIGGFVPSAKYKGNVYVRSFQIEKDE